MTTAAFAIAFSSGAAIGLAKPQQENNQQRAEKQSRDEGVQNKADGDRARNKRRDASDRRAGDQQSDNQQTNMHDHHSPALGVMVGACPGEGVCVIGSLWGSPAHNAGIRGGDYILAVNGKKVDSPQSLRELVQQQEAGDQVQLSVWRQGEVVKRDVTLATEATEPPNSHRAWLGVMLRSPEQGEGIVIEHVHPGSPAEEYGLRAGDRIVALAEEEISSIEDFINDVRDYGPGSELKITIERNGKEQLLSVLLGEVDEAPLRWMRYAFRTPIDQLEREFQSRQQPGVGVMDEVVDDLRRQMRQLQQQMDDLTSQAPGARNSDGESAAKQDAEADSTDESSEADSATSRRQRRLDRRERRKQRSTEAGEEAQIDTTTLLQPRDRAEDMTLVVQRPNRGRDQRGRGNGRGNDQRFGKYGNPDFYDRLNNQRNRNRFQYNNRYRSFYGYPGNRVPYGNQYYRYGGRPYYYGGSSLYGPRFGVRIGPRLGLYWY